MAVYGPQDGFMNQAAPNSAGFPPKLTQHIAILEMQCGRVTTARVIEHQNL
jgi:hypothetical protein